MIRICARLPRRLASWVLFLPICTPQMPLLLQLCLLDTPELLAVGNATGCHCHRGRWTGTCPGPHSASLLLITSYQGNPMTVGTIPWPLGGKWIPIKLSSQGCGGPRAPGPPGTTGRGLLFPWLLLLLLSWLNVGIT